VTSIARPNAVGDMTVQARFVQRETLTLAEHGLNPERILPNLTVPRLIEYALRREEGVVTDHGAFAAVTTPKTGRSPKDKFVVVEPDSESRIWWDKNARMESKAFERLHSDVRNFLDTRELFVQDLFGGAEHAYRLSVRFITPSAWHALFVRHMFIRPQPSDLAHFQPGFTVLHAPEFHADPARHGTRGGTFVAISFTQRIVLIGGTRYAGEMKKSIFTARPTSDRTTTPRSSSGSPAPARPRSRPIPRAA
jgi:phosphoenolpyruvate carboxykinase (ATP)